VINMHSHAKMGKKTVKRCAVVLVLFYCCRDSDMIHYFIGHLSLNLGCLITHSLVMGDLYDFIFSSPTG